MKKILLSLVALMSMCFAFAQDYKTTYTSNVEWATVEGSVYLSDKVIIDGTDYAALKLGTSKATGTAKVTVPTGTKVLHMHIAAWSTATNTKVTATVNGKETTLPATPCGVSGTSPYTLTGAADTYQLLTISETGVTAETEVTLTSAARVVFFGLNAATEQSADFITAPTITPTTGSFSESQTVTITAEEKYDIIYTLDGTTPADGNGIYVKSNTTTFQVDATTTVKAIAVDKNDPDNCSSVATSVITILKEVELPKVDHISIAEFLQKADTETTYELTGKVTSIVNTKYGNLYIEEDGASVYLYGVLDKYGQSANFASLDIAVGDILTVQGKYVLYNETVEIKDAQYVKHEKGQADPYTPEGDGTLAKPYTAEDVKHLNGTPDAPKEAVWVKGTIVGTASSGTKLNSEAGKDDVASNLAIGSAESWIPVGLPNNEVRVALNIVDNPTLKGTDVWVKGTIESYFSTAGVKNVSDYSFDGVTTTIKAVSVDNVSTIYNLAGQRVEKMQKGINIVGGKKVIK